ncbi:hypothetical protein L2E82_39171 [Cichorium intybus]|uniref:Uncharacterized protein n=1 Tax=Cichorium intybus TaxID=13427 RepID=A0ACB9AGR7_CICIN|nr:hypothetical protein L2E82_39171 [Cichorium intybus]
MASANLSMPRASVPAGPPALVQPPITAAFLKHRRTPPGGGPGLEYHMAESEHLMKRAHLGPSDELFLCPPRVSDSLSSQNFRKITHCRKTSSQIQP